MGIALSTWAQSGTDLDSTRYRLLPLAPWRILLARDSAYLLVQIVLTLALSPVAGLTFGMTALAIGRYPSLGSRLHQERWRFASGRVPFGAAQMILGAALVMMGGPGLAIAMLMWVASVAWGGSALAKRLRGIDTDRAPRR